jgi:hypothetical protein
MLVYGDAIRRETVESKLANVRRYVTSAEAGEPWIVRHGFLVAALIEAGELTQGVADNAFEARGRKDSPVPEAAAAMELTLTLARLVGRSWQGENGDASAAIRSLSEFPTPARDRELTIKIPEGFAFYALYPETYFEAALPLAGRKLQVIGIRSIGTTLGAMVAAGAGAPCPMTVRPVGHPFARELALADGETLGLAPDGELAIVDEGPGLSGSSVVAVADAASREGIGQDRIHVFPSHLNGPGPQTSEEAQRFWREAQTRFVAFDELALLSDGPGHRLESWISDLVGNPIAPIREISGGGWRALRFSDQGQWPPAHQWQERRKFLVETGSGKWILKFAGLGRIGLEKLARAQALAEAGFAPRPLGFRHGFLIERWHEDAQLVDPLGPDRPRLLATLGAYLGFRARQFPASDDRGASTEQLFEMLRVNAEEELGLELAASLESWRPLLGELEGSSRRVETDSRLHAWEWLVLPDGSVLKADAVDHYAGHDLVGCQDIAWDVAGATIEFTLSPGEQADLIECIERPAGFAVDRTQVRFATLCYSAFQLGYYREATASTTDSNEAARLRAAADRYSAHLDQLLAPKAEPKQAAAD